MCPWASFSGVVQTCPPRGTNWRSSSQMRQRDGDSAASGYEVPQAQQIWIGIEQLYIAGAGKTAAGKHVAVQRNTTSRSQEPSSSNAVGPDGTSRKEPRKRSPAETGPEAAACRSPCQAGADGQG